MEATIIHFASFLSADLPGAAGVRVAQDAAADALQDIHASGRNVLRDFGFADGLNDTDDD